MRTYSLLAFPAFRHTVGEYHAHTLEVVQLSQCVDFPRDMFQFVMCACKKGLKEKKRIYIKKVGRARYFTGRLEHYRRRSLVSITISCISFIRFDWRPRNLQVTPYSMTAYFIRWITALFTHLYG